MIAANSRYANAILVTETIDSNDTVYITPSEPTAYTFQYNYYIVTGQDRIDNIAAAFLSDPTQWYLIANANPQIINWFDVAPGTIIRVPIVSVAS